MPRQNRVDPYGRILAVPERGTMMGNRGVLHNDSGHIVRNHRGERWICCELQFKGRKDPVMAPGFYTRLFFLDEATALAAGHRPCAECRRPAYNAFLGAWTRAHAGAWSATTMDAVLHRERLGTPPEAALKDLPEGSMVEWSGQPHLVRASALSRWSPGGYTHRIERPTGATVKLLTPASTVKTIHCGYVPNCGLLSASLL